MAQNGFGVYVGLHVRKDSAAIAAFNREVEQAVASAGKIDIGKALSAASIDALTLGNDIQKKLDRFNFRIRIHKFDADGAIAHLRSQINSMIGGISVNTVSSGSDVSGTTSEQTASAEERAANAAERRAAANASSAQSAGTDAAAEQRAAIASEQRLQYNEQNHTIAVETSDLNRADTELVTKQLSLLSQIIQMRSTLTGMMNSGVVSSDGSSDASALLNTLNQLQDTILSNLTPTKAEFADLEAQVMAVQAAMKALNEELIQAGNIGSATTQSERFSALEKKLLTLRTQIQSTLNGNSRLDGTTVGATLDGLLAQVDSYLFKLRSMGAMSESTYRGMSAQINRMTVGFKSAKDSMVAFGLKGDTIVTRLKNGFQKFGGWMIVTRVLTSIIRLSKQVVTNVKEIDTALTQLRIVTKATNAEMTKFGSIIAQNAKDVGASINDLVDSATTYARLGYSLNESSTLAKYTSMLQTVGDIDVSDAQDAITAITKAFNIDVTDIETVMDKLVEVGNNFPISVDLCRAA